VRRAILEVLSPANAVLHLPVEFVERHPGFICVKPITPPNELASQR